MRYFWWSLGLHGVLAAALLVSQFGGFSDRLPVAEEALIPVEFDLVHPSAQTNEQASTPSKKAKMTQKEQIENTETTIRDANSTDQREAPNADAEMALARSYAEELKVFIESHRQYPRSALKLKQSGVVTLRLKISSTGEFEQVDIIRPSSSEILNRAARQLLESLKGFKPPPKELRSAENFVVPIVYQLGAGS